MFSALVELDGEAIGVFTDWHGSLGPQVMLYDEASQRLFTEWAIALEPYLEGIERPEAPHGTERWVRELTMAAVGLLVDEHRCSK